MLDLYQQFPLIVVEGNRAEGFIAVNDEEFYVTCAREKDRWKLLSGSDRQCHKTYDALDTLLIALREELDGQDVLCMDWVELLARELNHAAPGAKISDSWRDMDIPVYDPKGHTFSLNIVVERTEKPKGRPVLKASLSDCPVPFTVPVCSIDSAINDAQQFLHSLAPFFALMEKVDAQCHVMEPMHPQRYHTFRRLKLENQSVRVTVNPLKPCALPTFRFMGSTAFMRQVPQIESEAARRWPISDVCDFVSTLNTCLPADAKILPVTVNHEEEERCGVCYDDASLGATITCAKEECSKVFHADCLWEWFNTISTSGPRDCGPCPYCQTQFPSYSQKS